jgi:hypothetical protein
MNFRNHVESDRDPVTVTVSLCVRSMRSMRGEFISRVKATGRRRGFK